jgi:hypothetical protein
VLIGPQTATDSHRQPQTATDSHRQPQTPTDTPQTATDRERARGVRSTHLVKSPKNSRDGSSRKILASPGQAKSAYRALTLPPPGSKLDPPLCRGVLTWPKKSRPEVSKFPVKAGIVRNCRTGSLEIAASCRVWQPALPNRQPFPAVAGMYEAKGLGASQHRGLLSL